MSCEEVSDRDRMIGGHADEENRIVDKWWRLSGAECSDAWCGKGFERECGRVGSLRFPEWI